MKNADRLADVVDCQTNASILTNIAQFFGMWKDPELRQGKVLKLKVGSKPSHTLIR